ncbi:Uncharacterised protein [Staphylococcus agnetis]|uniref:YwqH-like family protein n=1 Tax=Staphylococcus agnetis TaxID=985762 RepID=UPI000E06585E|nr:DUF5082 family protein [Staphylococcus agnetis]SUK17529.1 Uncharacterised protein [Staphylococcus agnetis]
MSNKSGLLAQKLVLEASKATKESSLSGLKSDKERLEKAISTAKIIKEDFNDYKSTYNGITIEKTQWSGTERDNSDKKKDELDEAIKDYEDKYDKILEDMDKDLKDINSDIENVQSEITRITNEIRSITSQLEA